MFSSLIAFNEMLTSHCDNLSTHHYHVTSHHPSFDTQFRHSADHATIFLRYCRTRESGGNRAYVLQEKAKAIDLPFCTKEIGKKIISKLFWQGLDWQEKGILTNVVKDPQQLNPAAVVANFVALFVSTDHMDQKAICIVSYPVYYHHSYSAACISECMTCFLPCQTRSMPRLSLRRICPA